MKHYVVGFLMQDDECLMVNKTKPAFMSEYWNGIGGKIEDTDEDIISAMERETFEETGLKHIPWTMFAILLRPKATIYCFHHRSPFKDTWDVDQTKNDVGETLAWINWPSAPSIFKSAYMLLNIIDNDPVGVCTLFMGDH